jgi:phosphoketolase
MVEMKGLPSNGRQNLCDVPHTSSATDAPLDMVVLNELDRYHLSIAAIERIPALATKGASARQMFRPVVLRLCGVTQGGPPHGKLRHKDRT